MLASSSKARRELLARLLPTFEVVSPGVDEEGAVEGCAQADVGGRALALAAAKARHVARLRPDAVVIGADTLTVCQGEVMGKPKDADEAARMLRKLTRHPHQVVTAVVVVGPDGRERSACVEATVTMRPMPEHQVQHYAGQPDALNRAGAYGLLPDDPNVAHLEGSATAVMGLPLEELEQLLRGFCVTYGGKA